MVTSKGVLAVSSLRADEAPMGTAGISVGRSPRAFATALTVIAAVAYFLMMAMSEYRFQGAVFWTIVLAAPIIFALGPRQGLLRRLGLGFVWAAAVAVLTMMAVMAVIFAAVTVFG